MLDVTWRAAMPGREENGVHAEGTVPGYHRSYQYTEQRSNPYLDVSDPTTHRSKPCRVVIGCTLTHTYMGSNFVSQTLVVG